MDNLIAGIFGLQGSGKTALATWLAYLYHDQEIPVYSNYHLYFDYKPVTTLKEAQSVRNGVLLLDEVWMWCHARTSASKINQEMMKIILMNRKRNVDIIYTTQLKRTVDIILKEVTNFVAYPAMIPQENDGKKHFYISYISANLAGKMAKREVVPYPIDVIGSMFNTKEEVKKPGTKTDPLSIGIGLEHDFAKAVKKKQYVRFVDVLPVSGHGTSWKYDVLIYGRKKNYAVDVKSSATYVPLHEFGDALKKKIQNAYYHRFEPMLAFPVVDRIRLTDPSAWYVYPLTMYCYLVRMRSMPSYSKLSKNSILMDKWSG